MLPNFLLPEQTIRQNGSGPAVEIDRATASVLTITLGISRIIEQESLDVTIRGSADGVNWGDKAIAAFPQKFYCGVYKIVVDLEKWPDLRFLRADWKANRWGRGGASPLFGIYVFAEPLKAGVLRAAS